MFIKVFGSNYLIRKTIRYSFEFRNVREKVRQALGVPRTSEVWELLRVWKLGPKPLPTQTRR